MSANSEQPEAPAPSPSSEHAALPVLPQRRRRPTIAIAFAVLALLTLHAGLAISSMQQKSLTFDEIAHFACGLSALRTGDFAILPQVAWPHLVMAAPAAASSGVTLPETTAHFPEANDFVIGGQVFFDVDNDADRLQLTGRLMMVLLSVALGAAVFAWSASLFGWRGGLLSLTLYALSPTMLAHSRVMALDVAMSLVLLLFAWSLWRCMRRPSAWLLVACSVLAAMALLTKASGVVVVPIAIVLGVVRLIWRSPMRVQLWPGRELMVRHGAGRAAVVACIALGHVVIGMATIWLFYHFRFEASPKGVTTDGPGVGSTLAELMRNAPGLPATIISYCHAHRLLPEAFLLHYAYFAGNTARRESFLLGQYSVVGWWYFFPVAFALKTSLGVLATLLLASWRGWTGVWCSGARVRRVKLALLRTAPLWALIGCFGLMAINANINIGHRHILPLYPALFVLAGVLGRGLRLPRLASARSAAVRSRVMVGSCVAVLAIESLLIWPSYLSFFNLAAGGPGNGYRIMVDSSLDWGQDLPLLADWLDSRVMDSDGRSGASADMSAVHLAYFGTDQPQRYGIDANDIVHAASPAATPLSPGLYVVSATHYQSIYIGPLGRWNAQQEQRYQQLKSLEPMLMANASPELRRELVALHGPVGAASLTAEFHQLRLGRLMAYLSTQPIVDRVGHTMLVFRLDEQQVREALHGSVPIIHGKPRGVK